MDEVKISRIRRSESQWRELLARQAASGKPINQFCDEERVHPTMFRRWRAKLGRAAVAKRPMPAVERRAKPFIDIGAIAEGRSSPRLEVRLELGAGVILSIARD